MFTGGSDDEAARIAAAAVPGASKSARRIPVMSDPRHSAARTGAFPQPSHVVPATGDGTRRDPAPSVPAISVSAMSVEDYARVVQVRTEFVDFLLAPARGELAAAA
jgi:hypothetical protein